MKMAKATKEDMDMAIELCHALEQIGGRYTPCVPEAVKSCEADDDEYLDYENAEQCERVIQYLRALVNRASLMRVVFGFSVVLDECNRFFDPDEDCLAHHPDRIQAEQALTPKPLEEWTEEDGPVLWWSFPVVEEPYVGSPLCSDWPGGLTHFTPIIVPKDPAPAEAGRPGD